MELTSWSGQNSASPTAGPHGENQRSTQGLMDEKVHRRNPHRAQVVDLRQQALEHGYRNLDYIHPPPDEDTP